MIVPTETSPDIVSQGSGCNLFKLNAILKFSRSILIICTSNVCPICTKFSGSRTVSHDNSDICIKPSAPSISTNTPNLDVPNTFPLTTSPTFSSLILSDFNFNFTASNAALSENIALFRLLFNSVILNSTAMPIKPGFGGPDGV